MVLSPLLAQVTGFTARVEQATGATVAPADWVAVGGDFWAAPEHAGGAVNRPTCSHSDD